jgi:hypothetical protein
VNCCNFDRVLAKVILSPVDSFACGVRYLLSTYPILAIFTAMDSPHTPEQDEVLKEPGTDERNEYFWHLDHRRLDESMKAVSDAHCITSRTGRRWRREREEYGTPSKWRMRKYKAHFDNRKLSRPPRIA